MLSPSKRQRHRPAREALEMDNAESLQRAAGAAAAGRNPWIEHPHGHAAHAATVGIVKRRDLGWGDLGGLPRIWVDCLRDLGPVSPV
jgi:hypothetical protein